MAKVVFCQSVVDTYFGIMSIAALLKKHGHTVELFMGSNTHNIVSDVIQSAPDIVAFSVMIGTGAFEWSLEVAHSVKSRNPDILTALGGLQPTLFPEKSINDPSIDIVCQGEGEYAMLDLCNCIDGHTDHSHINNLWVKRNNTITKNSMRPLIKDLDELPFPDRSLYDKYAFFKNADFMYVQAGRGCLYDCSYCYNHVLKNAMKGHGPYIRKHSTEYLIRELEEIKEKYAPKSILFIDELFVINTKWVKEFTSLYKKHIALPFSCWVRADSLTDEIASLLADSGAFQFCIGLETGNEDLRMNLLNKKISNAQFLAAAQIFHKYKIKFLATVMIGLPGETVDNAFETIDFARHIKTDFIYFTLFQPYPKLELTKKIESVMKIAITHSTSFNPTMLKTSPLQQKNITQLMNLHKLAFLVFKFPFTKPLVRQLIKLPPNFVFDFIYFFSYAVLYIFSFKMSFKGLLSIAIEKINVFYGRKSFAKKYD